MASPPDPFITKNSGIIPILILNSLIFSNKFQLFAQKFYGVRWFLPGFRTHFRNPSKTWPLKFPKHSHHTKIFWLRHCQHSIIVFNIHITDEKERLSNKYFSKFQNILLQTELPFKNFQTSITPFQIAKTSIYHTLFRIPCLISVIERSTKQKYKYGNCTQMLSQLKPSVNSYFIWLWRNNNWKSKF